MFSTIPSDIHRRKMSSSVGCLASMLTPIFLTISVVILINSSRSLPTSIMIPNIVFKNISTKIVPTTLAIKMTVANIIASLNKNLCNNQDVWLITLIRKSGFKKWDSLSKNHWRYGAYPIHQTLCPVFYKPPYLTNNLYLYNSTIFLYELKSYRRYQ